jgi:hypothetical protein
VNDREKAVVETVKMVTFQTLKEGTKVHVGDRVGHTAIIDWHCCVLAARIAKTVLAEHYINAKAMKVQVLTYNEKAWQAELRGEEPMSVEGGVVAGCGIKGNGRQEAADPGMLNGHVVLIVENELLLDPSAVQFTKIEHGILVEPLVLDLTAEDGREWLSDPGRHFMGTPLETGGAILYRQSPDLSGLYDAGDWIGGALEQEALTKAVSDAVRALVMA